MAKTASASGKQGLSYTLQMRLSALPLRNDSLVVLAWAIICPPMGFFASATANMAPPST